jgi:hypothetical protein
VTGGAGGGGAAGSAAGDGGTTGAAGRGGTTGSAGRGGTTGGAGRGGSGGAGGSGSRSADDATTFYRGPTDTATTEARAAGSTGSIRPRRWPRFAM